MANGIRRIKLLIDGTGNKGWIGGLYYRRNILFSLLADETISERLSVIVITEKGYTDIFAPFENQTTIKYISYKSDRERKIKLILLARLLNVKYIFPSIGKWGKLAGCKQINWIPDFQHNRLREFFPEMECDRRTADYQRIADSDAPLVLSSRDCLHDFREFYSQSKQNVYVVPFVSYIAPELQKITKELEHSVLEKFGLKQKKYIAVMNQFWQHKNHKVIFEAMKLYFANYSESNVFFVFTGMMEDYRNPAYIQSLKQILQDRDVNKHTIMLGFIDRTEQLVIMKNAAYIIQPSLFEGWGTVVEDAKVLDKTIILSDIPVHREQRNQKCIMFDPYNPEELADLIAQENEKNHQDDLCAGLEEMTVRAISYSVGLNNLLSDAEKRNYE